MSKCTGKSHILRVKNTAHRFILTCSLSYSTKPHSVINDKMQNLLMNKIIPQLTRYLYAEQQKFFFSSIIQWRDDKNCDINVECSMILVVRPPLSQCHLLHDRLSSSSSSSSSPASSASSSRSSSAWPWKYMSQQWVVCIYSTCTCTCIYKPTTLLIQ